MEVLVIHFENINDAKQYAVNVQSLMNILHGTLLIYQLFMGAITVPTSKQKHNQNKLLTNNYINIQNPTKTFQKIAAFTQLHFTPSTSPRTDRKHNFSSTKSIDRSRAAHP